VSSAPVTAVRRALLGVGAGIAALGLAVSPALATATPTVVPIKDSQVPTTAQGFEEHDCEGVTQRPGDDAWHLVLPANSYDFVTVTGQFADTQDGPTTFTATAPGPHGEMPEVGNATGKHAYLFAPAGMWLTAATAVISGEGKQPEEFVLSHTCPGVPASASPSITASPSSSASPSVSATPEPSTSTSPSESSSAGPVESAGPSGSATPAPGGSSGSGGDGLPVTGTALTGILGAGLLLLAGGAALVVFARRRVIGG
jgi:hypothetical protein